MVLTLISQQMIRTAFPDAVEVVPQAVLPQVMADDTTRSLSPGGWQAGPFAFGASTQVTRGNAMERLVKKFTEVVEEVRLQLEAEFGVTQEQIDKFRQRVDANGHSFPTGSYMTEINDLYLDYEVQRAAIAKHILKIMKNYDPRLCTPASACKVDGQDYTTLYDGQQRSIATALLGFTQVPATVVETDDVAFPSYAFEMLNETGIVRLTPGDMHRNALTRYRLGSHEPKNIRARTLQNQFDSVGIDLQDKGSRKSANLRGNNDYFFSHFKYAYKGIELDEQGRVLNEILSAIVTVFPLQEEIDQGCFIGLYEIARLDASHQRLKGDWMKQVLRSAKKQFSSSATVHAKAKMQWAHVMPGATWSAPSAMSNFLRELYIMDGGTLNIPHHGAGASMQVATNPAPQLFPKAAA